MPEKPTREEEPGPCRRAPGVSVRARSWGRALSRPDSTVEDLAYKREPGLGPWRLRQATDWVPDQ